MEKRSENGETELFETNKQMEVLMTGKVYVLNNGVFMMTLPRELRNKARLNEGDKLLFGVVKVVVNIILLKIILLLED